MARVEIFIIPLYPVSMELTETIMKCLTSLEYEILYLFGSYGKGKEYKESDIDLAFLSSNDYDEYKIFLLAQELGRKLGREVDLVQLKKSSTVFQNEVISKGSVLFEKDRMKRENFEMVVLKKYTRLNEERASILEDYERRYYNQ